MKRFIFTVCSLAFISASSAQTYMELGYTSIDISEPIVGSGNSYDITTSPSALRGLAGYEINPNVNLEGLFAQGLGSSNVSVSGISTAVKFKIDNLYGIYVKPKLQLAPEVEVFARIGYAKGRATSSYQNVSSSSSGSSFSYGLGLSYAMSRTLSLNIDAMSYYDKDSVKVTGTTIGIGYKF